MPVLGAKRMNPRVLSPSNSKNCPYKYVNICTNYKPGKYKLGNRNPPEVNQSEKCLPLVSRFG